MGVERSARQGQGVSGRLGCVCAEAMVRVGRGGWRRRIKKTLFKMLLLLSPL